jgi:hypothetical protein
VVPAAFGEVEDPTAGAIVPSVVDDPSDPGVQPPPNQAPDCSNVHASVVTVWPPDNRFVGITVLGVIDPDGDPLTILIDSVYQDEPVDSYGDGSFAPDAVGVGTDTVQIRAERSGAREDGRVYHVAFTAYDDFGGSCSSEVTVAVPHDQAKPAIDGGAIYDATGME